MDDRTGANGPTPYPEQLRDHAEPASPTPYQRPMGQAAGVPFDDMPAPDMPAQEYREVPYRTSAPRKHMGVATSDPDYLPVTDPRGQAGRPGPAHPISADAKNHPLHYDRYLELPKRGKSIFISRRERKQRRAHIAILVIALLAIILALVWFFFLR